MYTLFANSKVAIEYITRQWWTVQMDLSSVVTTRTETNMNLFFQWWEWLGLLHGKNNEASSETDRSSETANCVTIYLWLALHWFTVMSVLSSSCPRIAIWLAILDHTLQPHSSRIVCAHSVRDVLVWKPYYIVPCELCCGQSRDK